MITLDLFLSSIQKNKQRITKYQSGADGSGGPCDCIGLIIGTCRLAGLKWTGTHGSNWTARNAIKPTGSDLPVTDSMDYIASASDLFLGEIVFKAANPGDSNYNLPSTYSKSPDRRDYYHVGVVTSLSPLKIDHVTKDSSRGIDGNATDTTLGKWRYGGKLAYVDYSNQETQEPDPDLQPIYYATVTAPNGYPVRLRQQPTQNAKILLSVPLNQTVGILGEYDQKWSRVIYNQTTGYMMSQFLIIQDGDDLPDINDGDITHAITRNQLLTLKATLAPFLQTIETILKGTSSDEE